MSAVAGVFPCLAAADSPADLALPALFLPIGSDL